MPLFDHDALDAQLKKLPARTDQQATVGAVVENGNGGVELTLSKDIGRHDMFVQGEASWFTKTGYRAAALFGWKPKP